ncbi:glycosyltransferase family 4 protein [Bacillus sp. IB182487]|uniref:Glycosyltransferase family 4 protein n=2 Tax=Metabacillus arenae TaxID=2771434 RepID=A0A926RZ26_9BACI|nr:glycosyltransferase family 4 protein [Metabacillus arenae]
MHIGEYVKGGVATYIKEVIYYQKQSQDINDIYLVVSNTNSDKDFYLPKEKVVFYKYQRSIKYMFKAMLQIINEINRVNPDIIHIHSTFAGFFVRAPLFLKKRKFKIVYCPHGWAFLMEISYLKKKVIMIVERLLTFKTDKIINISLNEQKEAMDLRLPISKLELINNGISTETRSGIPSLLVKQNNINLLFVGRFDRQKGLDILIEFFKKYSPTHIQLYIVGDSVLEKNDIEVPNNIINVGWIDNEELDSYYKLFDAVIIPSRWEGFGLVAIEAMKNKKPIIVSDRGALPDLVKKDNGYVFSLNNLSTLHDILVSLNKEELRIKGLNGYNYFISNFTSDIMNKKIINVYKKILQTK